MVPKRPSMLRSCEWDSPLHLASPKSEICNAVAGRSSSGLAGSLLSEAAGAAALGRFISMPSPRTLATSGAGAVPPPPTPG